VEEKKKRVAGGPLKVRNFQLLFGGQTISVIGDALYLVALPWLILTTGGSAEVLGIVLAAYGIPRAGCMLVGGWLSDRLRPRRVMLASRQGANLIGAALAGVVVAALTSAAALAIDALTFLVSALSLALMRPTHRSAPETSKPEVQRENPPSGREERGEQIGLWHFLRTSRLIQGTLLMFIVIGLVSGGLIEVALPTLVHGPLHANASGHGIILAGWGTGAFVGAIVAGALGKRQHKGLIMLLAGLLMAALIGLLPTWGVAFAVVCMLMAGVAGSIVNVILFTAVQQAIPSHLMGRVMGLLLFGSFGVYPLSVALAGVLSNQLGPASFFPFSGLLLALAMLSGMTQRALREI